MNPSRDTTRQRQRGSGRVAESQAPSNRDGEVRALMTQLRQLFDKTAESLDLDYEDKVNHALVAVYDFGRRRGKATQSEQRMTMKPLDRGGNEWIEGSVKPQGIVLTEREVDMVLKAIGFAFAGEWPWEPFRKHDAKALNSAADKIAATESRSKDA